MIEFDAPGAAIHRGISQNRSAGRVIFDDNGKAAVSRMGWERGVLFYLFLRKRGRCDPSGRRRKAVFLKSSRTESFLPERLFLLWEKRVGNRKGGWNSSDGSQMGAVA